MNKKAIALLGAIFLLIVGTLGFLIYSKYYSNKDANPPSASNSTPSPAPTPIPLPISTSTPENPSPTPTPSSPSATSSPKIVKLSDERVVSPVLFYNGTGVTYFDRQGQLFQANLEDGGSGQWVLSRKKTLQIPMKAGITKILWPSSGDDFLAEITNGSSKTWSFYNSQTGGFEDLPSQLTGLDWLPGGKEILYLWLEAGKTTLNRGDGNTKNWKYVADMWENDDVISISPDGLNVLYYRDNPADAVNAINLTTPDGKVWKSLVKDGYNSGVLWSPDSHKFLFGKKNPQGGYGLWVYDIMTNEAKDLRVPTTPDKAVWDSSSNSVYAAVPVSGNAGTESLTQDTFFKVDLTGGGSKTEFKAAGPTVDGRDLFLNKSGDMLLFRNAQDGFLYYVSLPL